LLITRTPLRVSLLGGGTDIKNYYSLNGGLFHSVCINKYIYISINSLPETKKIKLKYSKYEEVFDPEELQHPIVKQVLSKSNLSGLEITITSDVQAGTGLGSSSAFTVGFINAINAYQGLFLSNYALAEEASNLEIHDLKNPIGIQDHFAVAFGGINTFQIEKDGRVLIKPIRFNLIYELIEKNCILVKVPGVRSASELLSLQNMNFDSNYENLRRIHDISVKFDESKFLTRSKFGNFLHESWELKKALSPLISSDSTRRIEKILDNYRLDGFKLLGAGQSGYFFVVGPEKEIDLIANDIRLDSKRVQISENGSEVIYGS
jgi:D-glycero-alpha-D-manno-heptose-7-phosphate kinase